MRIEPIGASTAHASVRPLSLDAALVPTQKPHKTLDAEPALQVVGPPPVESIAAPEAPPTPVDAPAAPAEDGQGVLRLLEAGHFRGVADVRLRINFFEELSARAADRSGAGLAAESQALVSSMGETVEQLFGPLVAGESSEPLAPTLASFSEDVAQAASDPSLVTTPDALAEALQSAFDAMVSTLREQFAPASTPPTPEDPVVVDVPSDGPDPGIAEVLADAPVVSPVQVSPTEPTAEPLPTQSPGSALDDAIAALSEAFATALAELLGSLSVESQMPSLSSPNGNGQAYDKFLSTYNGLLAAPAVNEVA